MTPRKQRIALRDLSTLSPEDQEMAEKNRIEGKIPNIFGTLVNHPKLARSWLRFAGYILSRQTLPARDREIAILRISWLNQAPYEWEQQVLIGRGAGLTDDEIERIKKGSASGMESRRRGATAGGRRSVREFGNSGRNLGYARRALQHRADDGPGIHHRPVQPGLLGA